MLSTPLASELTASGRPGRTVLLRRGLDRLKAHLFDGSTERYEILELIGVGGMGVVVSALDHRLHRRVAIKKRSFNSKRAAAEASRCQREARILAALSHENVVSVYDVFTHGTEVSIVMEFVAGETLQRWLAATHPTQGDRLDAFLQAGAGLEAAHRIGIVHRDFKPSNAMIGADGRVRVLDFGLARAPTVSLVGTEPADTSASGPLAASTFAGTRRYAAPEQYAGEAVPASDQFAFCVSVYEALLEVHPFLDQNPCRGRRREHPSTWQALPRRVRAALERGMSAHPGERWPSMGALLAQLRHKRNAVKTWGLAAGLAALVAAGVSGPDPAPCQSMAQRASAAWNSTRRGQIQHAFVRASVPHGADTWGEAERRIDRWLESWHEETSAVCSASEADGAAPQDAVLPCLASALDAFTSYVDALEAPTPRIIESAVGAVRRLPVPAECTSDPPVPPPRSYSPARRALGRARARLGAGDPDGALRLATTGLRATRRATEPDVTVDLLLVLARARRDLGDLARVTDPLEDAAALAAAAGDDRRWLEVLLEDAYASLDAGGYLAAERKLKGVIAHAQRVPPSDTLRARALNLQGMMATKSGSLEAGFAHYMDAAEIWREAGDESGQAIALGNAGHALSSLGRADEGLELLSESARLTESDAGTWSPALAEVLLNVAGVAASTGDVERSRAAGTRAIAIFQHTSRARPDFEATVETILAQTFDAVLEEAQWRAHMQRALSLLEGMETAPPLRLAALLANYSNLSRHAGAYEEAIGYSQRGRALLLETGVARPALSGAFAYNVGDALLRLDRPAEAAAVLEPAHADAAEVFGVDHPRTLNLAEAIGRAALARGEVRRAHDLARQLVGSQATRADPLLWIEARLLHARVLEALGRRDAALVQAELALSEAPAEPSWPHRSQVAQLTEVARALVRQLQGSEP